MFRSRSSFLDENERFQKARKILFIILHIRDVKKFKINLNLIEDIIMARG